jgi:hypothetical protein
MIDLISKVVPIIFSSLFLVFSFMDAYKNSRVLTGTRLSMALNCTFGYFFFIFIMLLVSIGLLDTFNWIVEFARSL